MLVRETSGIVYLGLGALARKDLWAKDSSFLRASLTYMGNFSGLPAG